MAAFCLTKDKALLFKKALKSGEIQPGKLSKMSSAERRVYLEKFVGKDNAQPVNGLFESKLLLKNQKAGMIAWAKTVAGMTKESKRDIFAKIERLDEALNPKTEEAFLEDLVSTKLKLNITATEAKTIYALSKKVDDTNAKRRTDNQMFKTNEDRLNYGAAKVAMGKYISDLKNETDKLSLKERAKPKNYVDNVGFIAGLAKSLKASFDNSALLRQGYKTLWTNPNIWRKNAARSFIDFAKTIKSGEKVMDGVMADIVSRPLYEKMVRAKLAIGNIEEAYPTSLPEKVPVFGRFFRASQTSFEAFQFRQRADIFEKYIDIAEKSGIDTDDVDELRGIGNVVNALTSRGSLGKAEPVANIVNNVFFSPRFVKSHIDLLTHPMGFDVAGAKITPFARKQAAKNLLKVSMGTAAILTIANAINPDSIEEDPRSSNFGKIKIGNTRFEVTGGISSIATLAFRIARTSTKSSTTGKITELNSGEFGSKNVGDLIYDFFENKQAPLTRVISDVLNQEDFDGNKPTVLGTLNNLLVPLPVTNAIELSKDPNSAPILLALMADALGVGTNTYGQSKTDWNKSKGVELTQFKEKVGEEKFKAANEKFNKQYEDWFQKTLRNPDYQNLPDDAKQKVIDSAKDKIQKDIFRENFFFKKRKAVTSFQEKQKINSLLP